MDYNDGGWGAGYWLAMALMMLLLWGGLAALVAWAVRGSQPHRASPGTPSDAAPTPYEVLAERFARGEIDADEFQRSRDLLAGTLPRRR